MKKTIRTLSMVMMALAMALCFLFAGLTFVRADVLAEVDQSAIDTAAVYIGPLDNFDVNETGIKFTAKIKKTDYYALTGGVDAIGNTEVHLGVEVSRANADGSYTILPNAHYTVDTAGTLKTYDVGGVKLEDYFMYSFSVKYNLNKIFGADYAERLDSKLSNGKTIAENINFMYADELCIRPFYQVISEVDGGSQISDPVYGEYGASRSMVHVAMAEYADDDNSTLSPEEKELFISKYVAVNDEGKVCIENKGNIEVYADGSTNIEYDKENADNNPVTYTIGTSAKVVAREDGRIDASALKDYAYNDTFQLFGYTADRRVYTYNATFKGVEGVEATKVYEDVLYDVTSGKYFLNNTALENEEVLALYGLDNEKLSAGEINNLPLGESVNLKVVTNKGVYNVENFKAYTMVFEDTKESRELMASIFRGRAEENGVINGAYALAENLNFDHKAYDAEGNVIEGEYSAAEAFNAYIGFQKQTGTDDEGKPTYETVTNTFSGIFDGRGFALNNVLMNASNGSFYGLFGYKAGDGATIKNLAINDVYRWNSKTVISQDKSFDSLLFHSPAASDITITLENVYIYRHTTANDKSAGGVMFYNLGGNTLSKFNMTNVIIIQDNDYEGDKESPAFYSNNQTLGAGSVVNNVYIVTNSSKGTFTLSSADAKNSSNYAFYKLEKVDGAYDYTTTIEQKLAEFKAAGHDYSGFGAEYWTIIDGIPAWNSINTVAKIKDSTLKVQKEISSNTAGEKFTISVEENGEEITSAYEIVNVGDEVVTISGNEVTVNANVKGSATVIVKVAGEEVARFTVTVDTLPFVEKDFEVLLSALDGNLYFNGIDGFEGTIIADALYNDVSIFTEGKIDTTKIMPTADIREAVTTDVDEDPEKVKYANQVTLKVLTNNGNKYELTNVKLYSGVFDNSYESKVLMSKTFGQCREGGEKVAVLEGYYVLAENITFYDENDTTTDYATMLFGGSSTTNGVQVFDAVFDGRGYTLNNIIMDHNNINYGIFGNNSGPNAVLKNFALNGVRFYSTSAGISATPLTSYKSLFFCAPSVAARDATNKSEISNVYVNIKCGIKLFYNPQSTATYDDGGARDTFGFKTWSNVIVIMEEGTDLNSTNSVFLHSQNSNHSIALEKEDGLVLDDVYFVINGYAWGGPAGNVAYNTAITGYDGLYRYRNVTKMKEDTKNDYSEFDSKYWTIVDGIPAWNTCSTVVSVTNASDEKVTAITEVGEYTANAFVNGIAGDSSKVTVETESDKITVNGNEFTVGEGFYTATITVKYDGVVIGSYDVSIDSRDVSTIESEVFISKLDGKFYFNGVSINEESIIGATYNDASIYADGVVDTSVFAAVNTPYTVEVSTAEALFELTNVKVYDGVFENTQDSRLAMRDLFSAGGRTHNNYDGASADVVTGYYILLENITFDFSNVPLTADTAKADEGELVTKYEFFNNVANTAGRYNTFKGTLDGRGFAMSNIGILGNSSSMFGFAGDGVTLKNIAFDGLDVYTRAAGATSGTYYYTVGGMGAGAKFFYSVESADVNVTLENVYVNDDNASDNSTWGATFFFSAITNADGTYDHGALTFKNVIIENAIGPVICGSNNRWAAGLTDDDVILDTYVITTAEIARGTATVTANSRGENFVKCSALPTDANYTAFSADYWSIVNGVPVWKTLNSAE